MSKRVDISTFREYYKQVLDKFDESANGDLSKISLFYAKPNVNDRLKNFFNVADGNLPYEP